MLLLLLLFPDCSAFIFIAPLGRAETETQAANEQRLFNFRFGFGVDRIGSVGHSLPEYTSQYTCVFYTVPSAAEKLNQKKVEKSARDWNSVFVYHCVFVFPLLFVFLLLWKRENNRDWINKISAPPSGRIG